jgi:hypothetical protein
MPTYTTITGSLYDARTGAKVTSGRLYITPDDFIPNGADIIAPVTVEYSIPGTGNISVALSISNGVTYTVEFDSDPADLVTPRPEKDGYWVNTWTVPATGPVDIATL